MRILPRITAALIACSVVACTTEETPIEAPITTDEIEGAVIPGVVCTVGAAACSGTGDVYTSLFRVGRSGLELGEVAQTFKVGTTGFPGRVKMKMRLLRPLPAGSAPLVQVEVREVVGGVIPTASSATFAKGVVAASTLPRGKPAEVEFVLFQTGTTSVALDATKTYALVVNITKPDTGGAYVGIASHRGTAPYLDGTAYRRGVRTTTLDVFVDEAFLDYGANEDLSFSVTQGDGGAPAACWSTLMVWGSSMWNDDGVVGAGSLCSG